MAILDQQDIWAAYEELFYQRVNTPPDYGITYDAMASVLAEFTDRVGADRRLSELLTKLANGTTTYSDLDEFALLMGNHLGNAMYNALPPYAASADGYITSQIANAIIPAGLRTNYESIIEYAAVTQKGLNTRAGLGLNAVKPSYDYDREKGLVDYITEKPWSDRAKSFRDAVQENGQYYADESAKVNAKAHYNAGLSPVIKRIAAWRCCKWCSNLAGTYDYSPDMDRDVFRRHSNCNCKVLYDPGDGTRVQNVHSKKWASKEELTERKVVGRVTSTLTPKERIKLADLQNNAIIGGGITGGLDRYSKAALEHAERYYEAVRHMTGDIKRIAENTGFTEAEISRVKNHLFNDKHELLDGLRRFDPSYEISQSWQRLIQGNTMPLDYTLIRHELYEAELMAKGMTQDEAHIIASKRYNYQKEIDKLYGGIK